MSFADGLVLALVCLGGAMVPGASLVVVVKNAMTYGTRHGLITAWSHAVAVGLYALATVIGLAGLLASAPAVMSIVQMLGALFLLYMAVGLWRSPVVSVVSAATKVGYQSAAKGFLVAFLNPKLAIFFLAIFSQFVNESDTKGHYWMAVIAFIVDGLWYTLVVLGVGCLSSWLQAYNRQINRLFALALLALAIRLFWAL